MNVVSSCVEASAVAILAVSLQYHTLSMSEDILSEDGQVYMFCEAGETRCRLLRQSGVRSTESLSRTPYVGKGLPNIVPNEGRIAQEYSQRRFYHFLTNPRLPGGLMRLTHRL